MSLLLTVPEPRGKDLHNSKTHKSAGLVLDINLPHLWKVVLHPDHGGTLCSIAHSSNNSALDESKMLQPLLTALVAWSASFAHKPRFLATLALHHAVVRGLVHQPGWYSQALCDFVRTEATFNKMRDRVKFDEWINDSWAHLFHSRPV